MLATKRSAGVAPEVNLRECVTHMPPHSLNKAAHSGFETQRRHHQKSKTGVSVATKRSAGVAPEVNLRECVTHMPPHSWDKAAHSGFETQRRHHQKSKTGVSVAPQKELMSSKN